MTWTIISAIALVVLTVLYFMHTGKKYSRLEIMNEAFKNREEIETKARKKWSARDLALSDARRRVRNWLCKNMPKS